MYYEAGFNDVKNCYEVGEATLRVSDELEFKNNIYPEKALRLATKQAVFSGGI